MSLHSSAIGRRQPSTLGVVPAQQRLDAADVQPVEVELRLLVRAQPARCIL
jgi:hypothetical protein